MYFDVFYWNFRIVETMSYTDNVANFLEAPTNELDNIKLADLELIAGDVMERVKSQPNSPFCKFLKTTMLIVKTQHMHFFNIKYFSVP